MNEQFSWSIVDEMPESRGAGQAEGIYRPLYDLVREMAKPEVQASPMVRVEWAEKRRAAKAQSSLLSWFSRNLLEWTPVVRLRGDSLYIQIVRLPEGQERNAGRNGEGASPRKESKYSALRAEIDTMDIGTTITKKCPFDDARRVQDYAEYWIKHMHPAWQYESHIARSSKRTADATLYITRNA